MALLVAKAGCLLLLAGATKGIGVFKNISSPFQRPYFCGIVLQREERNYLLFNCFAAMLVVPFLAPNQTEVLRRRFYFFFSIL